MQKQQQEAFQGWAKFLNPASLRWNLIIASLFLAAYETLRKSIVEHIRGFYTCGFNQDGWIVAPRYQTAVLSRHRSPLRASLLWLQEMKVVDDADMALVDRIREHRNELAHDLPKFIATSDAEINVELIESIYQVVCKIDRWWVREVEIPANPDFDDQDVDSIDDAEIASGNMMFLQMMIQIATGNSADADTMYNHFMQMAEEHAAQRNA